MVIDTDPSCSQDQMEDKWASVMLSPFSRKHALLKFDMHFDERAVIVSSAEYVSTYHMSVSDFQGEEKIQHNAYRWPGPGVPKGDLQCTSFALSEGQITE